ncbi:MAG: DNA repair protein RadC [Alphaproteobacteria bacterium]|nr:DNA repair protein RadC [Alphaproteobacteria bacterium]
MSANNAAQKESPHYHGHRDRLRERFLQGGPDTLQDYELLELVLFMAIPRRDVKPLAKDMLKKFGDLPGLLSAPVDELLKIDGISENTATALKAVAATAHRMMKRELMHRPVLNSWSRLMDYCSSTMAHETREHFRILFLNKKNELIGDEIQGSGTVDHTPAYPREIMKRALDLGATALILLHNHPSGDPSPSQADIDMTRLIIRAAEPFNIVIHDHIIIARNGYSSFKNQGLI